MVIQDGPVTRTGRAYERLRADILHGRVRPGAPLRLATLATELQVSQSVVREALLRLITQGLVTATPNQGFRVIPLSAADLTDLTNLRINLECLALEQSIAGADVSWEAAVVSAHHVLERTPVVADGESLASEAWIAAHAAFHDALSAGCGSPRLLALVRSMRDGAEIYRQWSGPIGAEQGRDIAAEHRGLLRLATTRDAESASAALRDHIQRTTDILLAKCKPTTR
jgi:DNA-binding GntR family transcriptional regulator